MLNSQLKIGYLAANFNIFIIILLYNRNSGFSEGGGLGEVLWLGKGYGFKL